jgi:hypothetical protein
MLVDPWNATEEPGAVAVAGYWRAVDFLGPEAPEAGALDPISRSGQLPRDCCAISLCIAPSDASYEALLAAGRIS